MSSPIDRNPITALRTAIMFLTRFPVGGNKGHGETPLSSVAWAFPLVGAIVGFCGALVFYLGDYLGLPVLLSAVAAVAVMYAVTGGLHEDGLSDVADGFGGGHSREQKLTIMRDSRVGTYGVAAMIFSILARTAAVASLEEPAAVAAALLAAGALSRWGMVPVMAMLPAARNEGLSAAAGRTSGAQIAGSSAVAFLVTWLAIGFGAAVIVAILGFAAMLLMASIAKKQIGGQTGDVLGATAQIVEITALVAISAR